MKSKKLQSFLKIRPCAILRAWPGRKKSNGWLLTETLLVFSLVLCLLTAFLPVLGQMYRQNRRCELYEEILRQGMGVDNTVFQALRYGRNFVVTEDSIHFLTHQGKRSGFTVHSAQFYLLLSNDARQPLTGASGHFARHLVWVRPYPGRPYFARNGERLEVAFYLTDEKGAFSWPFFLSVVPVNDTDVGVKKNRARGFASRPDET